MKQKNSRRYQGVSKHRGARLRPIFADWHFTASPSQKCRRRVDFAIPGSGGCPGKVQRRGRAIRRLCDNHEMTQTCTPTTTALTRADCEKLDAGDPLRHARARFRIADGTVYLDGNSLGAMPVSTPAAVGQTIVQDWGVDLIRSWNTAGWADLPQTVGDRLAPLLGALPGEVVIADSTSVNIFKLLAGILSRPALLAQPSRRFILTERGNFPTDLYIAEGISAMLAGRYELKVVEGGALVDSLDETVAAALITHVDYRSGFMHSMSALNQAAAQAGTAIVWDLSHSAGAVPLQLSENGTDFAAGCGYKYLNGGPGAPGFVYVRQSRQGTLETPLSGWFGHAEPFAFAPHYVPAPDIRRFLCGTPPVLGVVALNAGIATFDGIDLASLRAKSLALSELFWELMDGRCADLGFACVSPRDQTSRASHLSFAHEHSYAIMQAIIERGVIGDFRQPNLMRFGFTPLYTRFVDCWDAVLTIHDVVTTGAWRDAKFQSRNQVT